MKKIYSLLLLGVLTFFGAQSVWATVDWSQGGTLYVRNIKADFGSYKGIYWKASDSELKVIVKKTDNSTTDPIGISGKVEGDWNVESVMTFSIPANASSFKILRGPYSGDWTIWNQTDFISLESNKNYIKSYSEGGTTGIWNDLEWDKHTDWYLNMSTLGTTEIQSGVQFEKTSSSATSASMTLDLTIGASGNYYKLYLGSDNPGNGHAYKYLTKDIDITNCSEIAFNTVDGDANSYATLVPSISGRYTITIDFSTATLPVISVEFPSYDVRTATSGFGTICLPYEFDLTNATAYRILFQRVNGESKPTSLVLESMGSSDIPAGPYIIEYSGKMTATLSGSRDEETSANNMVGNLGASTTVANGYYVIVGNEACKVNGATVNCKQYYAYIDLTGVMTEAAYNEAHPEGAPSNIREIPMAPETTTAIENVEVNEKAVKFFENGQMYILRNGVTYDMTGRAVK